MTKRKYFYCAFGLVSKLSVFLGSGLATVIGKCVSKYPHYLEVKTTLIKTQMHNF